MAMKRPAPGVVAVVAACTVAFAIGFQFLWNSLVRRTPSVTGDEIARSAFLGVILSVTTLYVAARRS
jgi:hypothetical protein